jgi:hypothetical protein
MEIASWNGLFFILIQNYLLYFRKDDSSLTFCKSGKDGLEAGGIRIDANGLRYG